MSTEPADATARAKEIFLDALERPPEERAAFLDAACDGEALRGRVESLLGAHEGAGILKPLVREHPAPAPAPDVPPPERVGEYELLEELGRGAAGRVYRARQAGLGRQVALKVLRAGHLADEDDVRRFQREAEAAAALDHPGIVPIFEVGSSDGHHWFSMKCVEGPSLDRAVERFVGKPRRAAELVAAVAHAVHHAHQRGVLHRDLKPSNILLDAEGVPHVADFGIARPLGSPRITRTGLVSGTPAYMSPEEARGDRDVTVGADVWSLGCVLYELLAGRPAFRGESVVEVLRRVQEEEPPRLAGVPRDLETVVGACLAKDPGRRYASALALAQDLERWLAHEPISARPTTRLERLGLLCRRSPVAAALGLGVIVLLTVLAVGGSALSLVLRRQLDETRTANERARERLRASLQANARAERLSEEAGRRASALDFLVQAAELGPGPDLQNEAISALTLLDLATRSRWAVPEPLTALAVDPELARVALTAPDGRVEVRDPRGVRLHLLPGPGARIHQALFARDGTRLWLRREARGDAPSVVEAWDLEPEGPRRVFAREVLATNLALDRDGRRLSLAREEAGLVELLDAETFEVVRELPVDPGYGHCAFRPLGDELAVSTGSGKEVRIVALEDGELLATLEVPDEVRALAWSPSGRYLIAGVFDQRAYVWDALGWGLAAVLHGHEAEIVDVEMLDDQRAVTHSWDGTLRLWDVESATEILRKTASFLGFDREGRRAAILAGPSLEVVEVVGEEVLRVRRAHQGKAPLEVNASPDGRYLVSCGEQGWFLWDGESAACLSRLAAEHVSSVVFDPGGGSVLSSGQAGLLEWPFAEGQVGEPRLLLAGRCRRAGISADGRRIGLVRGQEALVLDRAGQELSLGEFPGVDRVALSPDGAVVAVGSWGGAGLRVWDAQTGELVQHLVPESDAAMGTFSPDGSWLAVSTFEGVRVLRTGTWELAHELAHEGAWSPPVPAAFDPGGGLLAAAVGRGRVRLLTVGEWEGLADLEPASPRQLFHLAFFAGGRRLAAASPSRRLLLWDLGALGDELERRGLGLERTLSWLGR